MSQKLYEESNIRDIASAIREQNGTQNSYTVAQMGNAVRAIHTQPILETLNATENGNYLPSSGKDGFSSVTVNVSGGEAVVQPLSVTQNGTYNPPSGIDGYAPVTVNVSGGGVNGGPIHIWTQSMGGMDAALNIQNMIYDSSTGEYSPDGNVVLVGYMDCNFEVGAHNCNNIVYLTYGNPNKDWTIVASADVTNGTKVYRKGSMIDYWGYGTRRDIYLRPIDS